jgi:hypothetical protein
VRTQFAGSTEYCPRCQRHAMERHMDRNTRWYGLLCERCAAALGGGEVPHVD